MSQYVIDYFFTTICSIIPIIVGVALYKWINK